MSPVLNTNGSVTIGQLILSPEEWAVCLEVREAAFDAGLFLAHRVVRHVKREGYRNESIWLETSGNGELTFWTGEHDDYDCTESRDVPYLQVTNEEVAEYLGEL